MKVARDAVVRVEGDLCQPNQNVAPHRCPQRSQVLSDAVRVVSIHDEERHDPEDANALHEVVIVIVVGILLRVGPSMPSRREGEDEDNEPDAAWFFR